ncbi:MarR family winged helix-turn-helix transcriptional regulator [Tessaracoccus oleiagri]|nr:MarR family transcriptional regulator [Tessaracoccus oleiagri]
MTRLANEVRLACQLVSHKVRFESGAPLPPHQLSVLFKLRRGSMTPGELAEEEQVTAPSMTKTLATLESQDLVARSGDPGDGRRRIISITPTGEAALRDAASVRDSFMEAKLATLSDEERATLAEAARILRRVLE